MSQYQSGKHYEFVISLNSTPHRLKKFSEANKHIRKNHFSAIDGRLIEKEKLIESGLLDPTCNYSSGAIGCALSHISLWDLAVKENITVSIFEDDAVVHPSFYKILQDALTRYDFIVWGWNFDGPLVFEIEETLGDSILMGDQDHLRENIQFFQLKDINPTFYPIKSCFGSLAYTVKPHIAARLLNLNVPVNSNPSYIPRYGKINNVGIDVSLSAIYQMLNAQVALPPVAVTSNDKTTSTINK